MHISVSLNCIWPLWPLSKYILFLEALNFINTIIYSKNWKFSKPGIVERIKEYLMHFVTRFRRNHGDFKPQHQFINFQKLILIILRHIGEKIRYHWNELSIYLHHKNSFATRLAKVQLKLILVIYEWLHRCWWPI